MNATMKKSNRYDTSGLTEARFEPGSRKRVLKNLLGVKGRREMERIEWELQIQAFSKLAKRYDKRHRFTASDICNIHKVWLGDIYEWAGKYRRVNVSKGDFTFADATQIPKLMRDFEQEALKKFTPCCKFKTLEQASRAIAIAHVELVLIHPFREGNGRAARMLADLMAAQADYPPLDYSALEKKDRSNYIAAIHAGLDREYEPMTRLFSALIEKAASPRKEK